MLRVLAVTAVAAECEAVLRAASGGGPPPESAPDPVRLPGGGLAYRVRWPSAGGPTVTGAEQPVRAAGSGTEVVARQTDGPQAAPGAAAPDGPPGHRAEPGAGADGAGTEVDVLAAGVGPAAAAAGTATALTAAALADRPYGLVISAGIGGGFLRPGPGTGPRTEPGTGQPAHPGLVVATEIVAADLGAQTATGFASVTELGFGNSVHRPPGALAAAVARATGAVAGPVLTVSTVTGTAERAAELAARSPGAAAEAMEGFGVAAAAAAHGVPVLEIRAVSNPVGPRDRAAWRIPEALHTLTGAFGKMVPVLDGWKERV